jgi:isocitrate dehydrogenase
MNLNGDYLSDALAAQVGGIGDKTVTYDFARLMDGSREVKCSEFGDLLIRNM